MGTETAPVPLTEENTRETMTDKNISKIKKNKCKSSRIAEIWGETWQRERAEIRPTRWPLWTCAVCRSIWSVVIMWNDAECDVNMRMSAWCFTVGEPRRPNGRNSHQFCIMEVVTLRCLSVTQIISSGQDRKLLFHRAELLCRIETTPLQDHRCATRWACSSGHLWPLVNISGSSVFDGHV